MPIVLIDDNVSFRQSLKKTLGERFPQVMVKEAVNGDGALALIERIKPQLVFMDIKLAGKMTLDLTKKIKSGHPGTVVAVLTSDDLPEYREVALKSGAQYFFSKGEFPWEEIMNLVEEVCAKVDC
jgi:two-component system response regulator YesN